MLAKGLSGSFLDLYFYVPVSVAVLAMFAYQARREGVDVLCAGAAEQAADLARLATYASDRVGVVRALLQRLATLPEAIEIGRVTGLTLGQVHCHSYTHAW